MIWPISLAVLGYWAYRITKVKIRTSDVPGTSDVPTGGYYKRLFWLTVAAIIVALVFLTGWQFWLWKNHEFSQFLLPPHNGIGYFLFYAGTRFWAPYLVSWTAGLAGFLGFWALNKKRGGWLLYDEELYFLWAAVFLTGHPGWILYLILMVLAALAYGTYRTCREKLGHRMSAGHPMSSHRVSLYHLWLPTATAAILINQLLIWYWEPYLKLMI